MPRRPKEVVVIGAFHKMATLMTSGTESYHDVCLLTAAHLSCSYQRVHEVCLMEDLSDGEDARDPIMVTPGGLRH